MNIHKTTLFATILAAVAAAAPTPTHAQISLEARGSLQRPLGDFADDANGDAGFGGDIFFNINPRLSIYGGYGMEMFGCEGCSDGEGLTSRGPELGVKLIASRDGAFLPWVRVGATYHALKVDDGPLEVTSDRRVGLQASAGLDIPLGQVLSFSPGIRYQTYRAEFEIIDDALVALQDVSFVSLDFGLHIHPGG